MEKGKGEKGGKKQGASEMGGLFGGLATFLEKLGELAEKGKELRQTGEIFSPEGKMRGVYGFTMKVGLGEEGLKVEPFGNVRKDEQTGRPVVHEVSEPMVDLFEEEDHVLVVVEMPGIGEGDVKLDLKDDILTLTAARGEKKYRKEVLLPAPFTVDKMSHKCRNGILEVKLTR